MVAEVVQGPAHGMAEIGVDSLTIRYIPNLNFNGPDSLRYSVSDGYLRDTTWVAVIVTPVNDAPVITSASTDTATEGEFYVYRAVAEDVEGDSLTLDFGVLPSWLSANADSVFGVPVEGAGDTIFVIIADDGNLTNTLEVALTVVPYNDPPLASDDVVTVAEDTAVVVAVLDNDSDPENMPLVVAEVVQGPAHGEAVINAGDTTLTYMPESNYFGGDTLEYRVSDGYLNDTAVVYITVNPVNDAPDTFTMVTITGDSTLRVADDLLTDSLVFRWTRATDADSDRVTYQFELSEGLSLLDFGVVEDREQSISLDTLSNWIHQAGLTSISGTWDLFATDGEDTTWVEWGPFELIVDISTLDIRDLSGLPEEFALRQNYPNPFNPLTTIQFDLPMTTTIRIVVYDLLGREVVRLVDGYMEVGYQQAQWDGRDQSCHNFPSGIYIARLVTPKYTKSIKMLLSRRMRGCC